MGIPFEALLPYGIIMAVRFLVLGKGLSSQYQMFGVTGVGLSVVKYYSNGRKNPRRGIDAWDRVCFVADLFQSLY
jgi:hypothetical protein